MRVASPDQDGLASVTGAAGAVTGGNTVRVANLSASGAALEVAPWQVLLDLFISSAWAQTTSAVEVTAAVDGSFTIKITASVGDRLSVTQINPSTSEESDPTVLVVPDNSPPLSFSPAAVTVDGTGRGYAVGSLGVTGIAAVIDLQLNKVIGTFDLVTNDPRAVDFNPTNNKLVIADPTNNAVVFVDLSNPLLQNSVAVTGAQSVAVDTVSNWAIVGTASPSASVAAIDLATETVFFTGSITNVDNPAAAYLGSPAVDAGGGRAVVVSLFEDGSSEITAKNLMGAFPVITHQEVVPNSSLQGVALFGGGNQALAADSEGNRAFFADLTGGAAAVAIPVGANPRSVALNIADDQGLISNFDDHTLSTIDLTSRTVADTQEVGLNPQGLAHFDLGNLTLVANGGNDSVFILH